MVWESGSICQPTKPVGCTQASRVNNGGLGTADLRYYNTTTAYNTPGGLPLSTSVMAYRSTIIIAAAIQRTLINVSSNNRL